MNKYALFPGSFKPPHKGHLNLIKDILKKVDKVIIFISSKPRLANKKEITKTISKKIWKIYLKDINNVEVKYSKEPSPIIAAYKYAKNNTLFLLKINKNSNNKRFNFFYNLKISNNIVIKEYLFNDDVNISSTKMRKSISNYDYNKFLSFIPKNISKENKLKIWNLLN